MLRSRYRLKLRRQPSRVPSAPSLWPAAERRSEFVRWANPARPIRVAWVARFSFRKPTPCFLAVARMSITREDVAKVALLARLELSDEQLDRMTEQLSKIVSYVDQLAEVDTTEVEPMAHAVEVFNVLAKDQVGPSLPRDDALANAPHRNDEAYLVPAVLGD